MNYYDPGEVDMPVQRSAKGEPVAPHPLRDMVHVMREMEQRNADRPEAYVVRFTAINLCMAGTHYEDEAERILAELEALGYVEQIPEHDPGSFRTTASGRVWLDEQLALVGIPAYDSAEYREAGERLRQAARPEGQNDAHT